MAFAAFADAPIDVGVIEVGMGGSWDATNVINAPVAVVTPISLDHQEWLGPSLTNIATEKAGIVHRGATLIAAPQEPEVVEVLRHRLGEVGATAAWAGLDFGVLERRLAVGGQLLTVQGRAGTYEDVFLPLHGLHQAGNAACALAAVEAFFGGANVQLDIEAVREGLRSADSPGRLEVVRRSPTVLLDAAHNPAGAATLAAAVSDEFSFSRLVGVVGVLADKDAAGILAALEPILYSVVVTANSSPRAASADALAASAVEIFGADRVRVEPRLDDAIEAAVEEAESGPDLGGAGVLVTGSIVTVGEARRLLRPRAGAG
jgi:dihydrofolate synthase/folylpolyglutamate synthase